MSTDKEEFSGESSVMLGHAQTANTRWRRTEATTHNPRPKTVTRIKVKDYSAPMPGDRT